MKKDERGRGRVRSVKAVAIGGLIGVAAAAALFLAAALLMERELLDTELVEPSAVTALFAAALIGGAVSALRSGKGRVQSGALAGVMLSLLFLLLALAIYGEDVRLQEVMRCVLAMVAGGACGGVLSCRNRKSKHKR